MTDAEAWTGARIETGPQSATLRYDVRPVTINAERAGTRFAHRKNTAVWREAFAWIAKAERTPAFAWCAVIVTPHLRDKRTQDVGACMPSAKAAIDGLVDAGVIEHDGPDIVQTLTFCAPIHDGTDALEIELIGEGK